MNSDPTGTLTDEDDEALEVDDDANVDNGPQPEDLSLADPASLALIREIDQPTELTTFEDQRPPTLPQPDRARSVPNLPKVKSSAFTRILR